MHAQTVGLTVSEIYMSDILKITSLDNPDDVCFVEAVCIDAGTEQHRPKVLIRSAILFNEAQVSGWIPENNAAVERMDRTHVLDNVDQYIKNTDATILFDMSRAFYDPKEDVIAIPTRDLFVGTATSTPGESYYASLRHELIHWSGIKKRCNRDLSGRLGSDS